MVAQLHGQWQCAPFEAILGAFGSGWLAISGASRNGYKITV